MEETSLLDQVSNFLTTYSKEIIFTLLLILLLWLLLQLLSFLRSVNDSGNSSGSSNDSLDELMRRYSEDARNQAQAEQAQKVDGLKQLIEAAQSGTAEDKQIAKDGIDQLLKQAGMSHGDLKDVSGDADLVRELAQSLELEHILGYSQALQVKLPEVKAKRTERKERSLFPTFDMNMETAYTPEDLMNATPEELYNRQETYEKLANGDLQVVTYYHSQVIDAILHMVIDVSGSMDEKTGNGIKKLVLARAVAYKLLTRAKLGNAKFLLRFFDGGVHPLLKANNAKEAAILANVVTNKAFSGSGTEILGAIKQAVADVKKAMAENQQFEAEIMLITDGEPNTPFTEAQLRKVLGEIKLHVIIIGDSDNDVLKAVATSYSRQN